MIENQSIHPVLFSLMLIAERTSFTVQHVAGDVERRLGVSAWQGKPLSAIIGNVVAKAIAGLSEDHVGDGFLGQLQTAGSETFDVTAHLTAAHVIVELERASDEGLSASTVINRLATASAGFERALSL